MNNSSLSTSCWQLKKEEEMFESIMNWWIWIKPDQCYQLHKDTQLPLEKSRKFYRLSFSLALAAAQAVLWRFWRQQGWIQSPWQHEEDCMISCLVLRGLQTPDLSFLLFRTAGSPIWTTTICGRREFMQKVCNDLARH